MTAARQLTVHNAQITTATVQVKTLTISGKQVTLAVFRQLREEPLITDDGYLSGVAWGVVNYHPDKCADASEHAHVVWQRGSELLRSRVWSTAGRDTFNGDLEDDFLTACAFEVLRRRADWFGGSPLVARRSNSSSTVHRWSPSQLRYSPVTRSRTFHLEEFPQVSFSATATAVAEEAWNRYREVEESSEDKQDGYYAHLLPDREKRWLESMDTLRKQYEAIGSTAGELHVQLRALAEEEMARRGRHADARKAIADLPQLFIAV